MYHLFVHGSDEAWSGDTWTIPTKDLGRCLRENTDSKLTAQYGNFDADAVSALRRFPCIFAYEQRVQKNPHFGMLRDVVKRSSGIRIEYEIVPLDQFLTADELVEAAFDLDFTDWWLNRTHWALKNIDLAKELYSRNIILPHWAQSSRTNVDIAKHHFDVGLSFPGEVREYVSSVARELQRNLGPHRCFYDNNYVSQLARPSLDSLLQELYGKRANLIVVFLCTDYASKFWCGIEFRSIREIINNKAHDRVMFVRMDDGAVEGVFASDGYIDGRRHSPVDVARFITERVELLGG
jgi:hypothetical protein